MIIAPGQGFNRDIFFIFFNIRVYCVFSLESPHRGDSNEYTQYTIFNMNEKGTINYPKSAAMFFFSKGLKNEFETAVVNEPSVFEPLKFYCNASVCSRRELLMWHPFIAFQVCCHLYSSLSSSLFCFGLK